jgi:exodeoxyribonuclease III
VLTLRLPSLSVVATYVPNSGQKLERLAYRTGADGWDAKLAAYVTSLDAPALVVGDLNCCHGAADFHNAYQRPNFDALCDGSVAVEDQYVGLAGPKKQAGLTAEERLSFTRMLASGRLVDAFRARHPDARGVFSYYSQRVVANRPANKGLRLDYVLATETLLPRVLDAFVLGDADVPPLADHTPVGCTIRLD